MEEKVIVPEMDLGGTINDVLEIIDEYKTKRRIKVDKVELCSEGDLYFKMIKDGCWEIDNKKMEKITNGDIIRTLFSDFKVSPDDLFDNHMVLKEQLLTGEKTILVCLKDWFDTPYRKPITMSEAKELEMFDMIAALRRN